MAKNIKELTQNADNDAVIVLTSSDGEEIKFEEIADIVYNTTIYAILKPVDYVEGMEEDEALVFKVTKDEQGEDRFEIELQDEVIDAVFEEYNRLVDEIDAN